MIAPLIAHPTAGNRTGGWKSAQAVRLLKEIKEQVSDRLPVVSRFYWTGGGGVNQ